MVLRYAATVAVLSFDRVMFERWTRPVGGWGIFGGKCVKEVVEAEVGPTTRDLSN